MYSSSSGSRFGKREILEGFDEADYFDTGNFLQRDGAWQAVAWQATKILPGD